MDHFEISPVGRDQTRTAIARRTAEVRIRPGMVSIPWMTGQHGSRMLEPKNNDVVGTVRVLRLHRYSYVGKVSVALRDRRRGDLMRWLSYLRSDPRIRY
jgi:hypothetical protein